MTQHLANVEVFAAVSVLGLSIILAVVSALSYTRLRHTRILFIGGSFLVFAVKGGFLVQQSFLLRGSEPWLLPTAVMDFVILIMLYLALRIR